MNDAYDKSSPSASCHPSISRYWKERGNESKREDGHAHRLVVLDWAAVLAGV